MKKIDFHSHFIPHIDDGAKDTATAIKILKESYIQEVNGIIATPHFKGAEKDVDSFVNKRAHMIERLKRKVGEDITLIPEIYQGAEVTVMPGLSDFNNLRSLCIENTDYILLEMPYSYWYDAIFDEIYKIIAKRGLIPIIAHVERYSTKRIDWEQYDRLFAMDIVLQFNADSFTSFWRRRITKQIIKKYKDIPMVLGSDVHDLEFRKTYYKKACNIINKTFGQDFLDKVLITAEYILQNKNRECLFFKKF